MNISRILIVGTGSAAKRHLRISRKLFAAAQIAVLKRNISKSIISDDVDLIFENLNDALNFSPTIAILANPAPFHISTAIAFAKIGTHLLIEKPLSDTQDGISELLEIINKKNVKLAIGYNLRYVPSLCEFKKYIEVDIVGKIYTVEVNYGRNLATWRDNFDYRNSVSASKELGGGVLFELSHEIDYTRWIFGSVIWVEAEINKLSNLKINTEDYANIRIGVSGKIADAVITINLDCFRRDVRRTCIVVGQKGTIKWDAEQDAIFFWNEDSMNWQSLYEFKCETDLSYEKQLANFVDCIKKDIQPKVSVYDGQNILEIIKAVRLSSNLKKNRVFL